MILAHGTLERAGCCAVVTAAATLHVQLRARISALEVKSVQR